jgi:iron complex transport system substrate-binding protein
LPGSRSFLHFVGQALGLRRPPRPRACPTIWFAFLCLTVLAAPPHRIISTAPSITEMLYAVGLGDRVVGVTTYCHYPPEARSKPKVGTYTEPNMEIIASLKPDLVIIQKNPINLAARLGGLRLNVLEVSHDTVDDVYVSMQRIADAGGVSVQGRAAIEDSKRQLADVRTRTAGLSRRKMMFIVGRAPNAIEDIIAVGRASYLNGVIEIAGGSNIFKDAVAPYPKVGMEDILSRNPEVIVDMGDMSVTEGVTNEHKRAVVALWNKYQSLAAVRDKRVFAVASDIFTVPGPRMVDAARAFAHMLHPEAGF